MDRASIIAALRAHEPELRRAGVASLSLFGSAARDEAGTGSDVDLVLRLDEDFAPGGLAWFGRVAELRRHLAAIVGSDVDVLIEPIRKERLRQEIERDRQLAF
jgi:predicted nucleotidyltransferase